MTGRVRVIRSRWWAEVLRAVGIACFAFLLAALWFGMFREFGAHRFTRAPEGTPPP